MRKGPWNIGRMKIVKRGVGILGLIMLLLLVLSLASGCASEEGNGVEDGTATTSKASEEGPEAFYEGKNVTFVVPYEPGGGYDIYARLVSQYLEEALQATVLVRNMPGGQTYLANRYVYEADPDGLTLMIADSQAMIMNQLTAADIGEGIDVREYEWLGRISAEPAVLTTSKVAGIETVEDLQAADYVRLGATAVGSRAEMTESVVLEAMGLDGEVVVGFKGSSTSIMSAIKGEVDGIGGSASSALDYAEQPELAPLFFVSRETSPLFPDLPTIEEAADLDSEGMKWVDALDTVTGVGRALLTTPGVPEERVEFLRMTLGNVLQDEEFLAQADEISRPISYLSGAEIAESINNLLGMPEEEAKELERVFLEKYVTQ